jgi:GTPase
MGASKSGETLNLMMAVLVSDLVMLKRAASAPDEIVTVADSETRIVAAVAEVAIFSAAENVEDEVKVGAVVSEASVKSGLVES